MKTLLIATLVCLFPSFALGAVTASALSHNGTSTVTVNVGEPVFLNAWSTQDGVNELDDATGWLDLDDCEWDFDSSDGVGYGDSISCFTYHKYSQAGSYTVTLRASEGANTDTDTVSVTVQAVPSGTTYYVTTGGNDSNTCTDNSADACLTIERGIAVASAGDTVEVAAGTYDDCLLLTKSGTANNPITIKAASGATPTITCPSSSTSILDFAGYDYITFDGFEFDGESSSDYIDIPNNSLFISILNSEIHHINSNFKNQNGLSVSDVRERSGTDPDTEDHLDAPELYAFIYNTSIHNNYPCNVNVSSDGNVFEDVDIYDPGLDGSGEDNYVLTYAGKGNYFKGGSNKRTTSAQDAHEDAWELYGATGVTMDGMVIANTEAELSMCDDATRKGTDMCAHYVFVNNVVYRSYASDQQQLKLRCAPHFKVYNNTFYGRLAPVVLDACTYESSHNSFGDVKNNIFMGNGSYSCTNDYDVYSVTAEYNDYYNCTVETGESNYLTDDPALTDPDTDGTGDFSLTGSSNMINAGVDTGLRYDITGDDRSGFFDIGAYEYIDSSWPGMPNNGTIGQGISLQ